jgi:hypothetical protein
MKIFIRAAFIFFTSLYSVSVSAQNDTTYYVTHNEQWHGRIYARKKYTTLNYQNKRDDYRLNYLPNTNVGLGLGVTYSWLTINGAIGFRFLDPGSKGETKYIDLQIHGYGKKFILDTFGQFYKGYYLAPEGKATVPGQFYYRPDLKMDIWGASFQYVFNNTRFSFRSSFLQSDWQKKSAGSLLVGLETYWGKIRADSTITPTVLMKKETIQDETKNQFFTIGPTVGYAYTLVVKKHFFFTGSLAESFNYGFNTKTVAGGSVRVSGFRLNTSFRAIAGYNSENWGLSVLFINNGIGLASTNDHYLTVNSGAFKVNYVHRFAKRENPTWMNKFF